MTEPSDFKPRSVVYKDSLAQVPAVVIGYVDGPKRRSPDYYAMNMVNAILTMGDSSRLRQELVKGKKSVIQFEAALGWPYASTLDYREPEPWAINLIYNPQFKGQQIVEQVQAEIAKLQAAPIDGKELERVKTIMRASRIRELQSAAARASELGQYAITDGDPNLVNTELDRMLAVTPEQVQAAAKKYLTTARRAVLEIQPVPQSAPQEKKQ
jgi:predicted Zn-dependent peptidase